VSPEDIIVSPSLSLSDCAAVVLVFCLPRSSVKDLSQLQQSMSMPFGILCSRISCLVELFSIYGRLSSLFDLSVTNVNK